MNFWTRVFLVALRIAIGWHFLFEGIEKVESVYRGPSEINRPWSSAGFLRESVGPFSDFFRNQAGDLDRRALERLEVSSAEQGARRMPPALEKDWNDTFDRFVKHYELSDRQTETARLKLEQAKAKVAEWLTSGEWEKEIVLAGTPAKIKQKTPDRIEDYRKMLANLREIEQREIPAFEHDVYKQKYRTLKAEAAKFRTDLLADADKFLKDALEGALEPSQAKDKGPLPPPAPPAGELWRDRIVMWGLVVVGSCLMLGLFTRLSCVLGAAFLLSIYLANPPFPGLLENIRAEGHYLFVNKNLLEMLALLALATVPSGKWAGLDGLIQCLNPLRCCGKSKAAAQTPPAPAPVPLGHR